MAAFGSVATAYRSFRFEVSVDDTFLYLKPSVSGLARRGTFSYAIPKSLVHVVTSDRDQTMFYGGDSHVVLHRYSGTPMVEALGMPLEELRSKDPVPTAPLVRRATPSLNDMMPLLLAWLIAAGHDRRTHYQREARAWDWAPRLHDLPGRARLENAR